MTTLHFLLCCACLAERLPSDYRSDVSSRVAKNLEILNEQGRFEDAARTARVFLAQIGDEPNVLYELAYAENRLGRLSRAARVYRRAIDLDASLASAWYDLGEIELFEGDLAAAENCFTQSVRLRPDHWAGFFRLAEVAARKNNAELFEKNLKEALHRGFSFRLVESDPNWRAFFHDERFGPIMRRFITVYSDENVRESFESQKP